MQFIKECLAMNWSVPTTYRQSRRPDGRTSLARVSGRLIVELGCWIVGIALIVTYFAATTGLENHRQQGIELFAQARAAGLAGHRLEDLPLAGQIMSVQGAQAAAPTPTPATATDADSLPIAVLRLASVGLEVPVYSDISELNLSRGAGWIEGTAAPNTGGNMAVAAHRDRFFRPLKDVQVGDILELESLTGHGEYRVSRIVIVDPDDVSVLDDTPESTVTLVTCYPFYFIGNAPQRYIVQATAGEQPGKATASGAVPTALPPGETL
jgi:sortase A